ncbi:uncharacterized protein LOC111365507 [Olea europaea var. sylvestris]|uniref:uncharacterized protein LOC111365507 n=1 Tax=Olea europaea var. sylvestris TaxID=158386 RepID=UPI000C1D24A9|nr:uncharacterized protein LOC111365507 [Olea europaea var. sylvestris]
MSTTLWKEFGHDGVIAAREDFVGYGGTMGIFYENIWLFDSCVDLLDALILGRNKDETNNLNIQETVKLSSLVTGKCLLKHHPIKWSPWDLCQLNFFTKMIYILATQGSKATVTPELRRLEGDAALRLFRSLLKAVNTSLKSVSITYDELMQCLNTIMRFLGKLCENLTLEDSCIDDSCLISLQFLEMASKGLEPSMLRSPLYKVTLDLKCIEKLKPADEVRSVIVEGICLDNNVDMASPVVYLSRLYFYVVVHSTLQAPDCESILLSMNGHVKFLLTLGDPLEVLHAFIGLLYKHKVFNCLKIWIVLANCLKDYIDGRRDLLVLNMELDNLGYSVVLYFLSYPFALCSFPHIKVEIHDVIELWELLFVSVSHSLQSEGSRVKSFSEDLCSILNGFFDEIGLAVGSVENQGFLTLYENIILYFLEQLTLSISFKGSKNMDCDGRICSNMKNSMELAARFMKLFLVKKGIDAPAKLSVPSRFLSALIHFVSCLHQMEDIVTLIKEMSTPLLGWLSDIWQKGITKKETAKKYHNRVQKKFYDVFGTEYDTMDSIINKEVTILLLYCTNDKPDAKLPLSQSIALRASTYSVKWILLLTLLIKLSSDNLYRNRFYMVQH